MRQWRKDGIPITEADLGDLATSDGEAYCEFGGLRFRFTAETIGRQAWQPAPPPGAAAVLTLRQVGAPPASEPIHLVGLADASPLDTTRCEAWQRNHLADAQAIAARTARRYVCSELFRRAEELIAGDQAA